MTERNKKSIYEGQDRRMTERRQAERRRAKRWNRLFEIIAIIVVTFVVAKFFHW